MSHDSEKKRYVTVSVIRKIMVGCAANMTKIHLFFLWICLECIGAYVNNAFAFV